jgi:flavin reductase (DIM6/NTAB) family NADH-FMN oxidoreductase RutF
MPIDDALFRKAMGSFTSGVTVVTTVHDNAAYGMTVSSFTSLSLKPQLLLVCIQNQLPTHTAILKSGIFAVSILAADQAFISQHFASKITDKFTGINCSTTAAGIPVIANACATFECTLAHVLPGGDHSIVVGALNEAHVSDRAPLVYCRGGYHQLA